MARFLNFDRMVRLAFLAFILTPCVRPALGEEPETSAPDQTVADESSAAPDSVPLWLDNYADAWRQAEASRSALLIFFREPGDDNRSAELEKTLADPSLAEALRTHTLLKLAPDASVALADGENAALEPADNSADGSTDDSADKDQAKKAVLLKRPEFDEMLGRPGLAVIDLAHSDAPFYRSVVSVFPFLDSHRYGVKEIQTILTLPPGTLTQRTMIYAVRVHPEAPQSTTGELHPVLVAGAESHSAYQAQIRLQGHHFWDRRFAELGRKLPGNLTAQEVCAEGWPWQRLLEAALDCVHCWRQSPGHWSSVVARQPFYGYDMKKGSNNVWYGTGLFGNRGESAGAATGAATGAAASYAGGSTASFSSASGAYSAQASRSSGGRRSRRR